MITLIRSAFDAAMRATAAAVETVHNARAPMPGARGEDEDYTHYQSQLAQGIESAREQALRGPHANAGIGTIGAVVNAVAHPNAVDDRRLLLEKVLYLLSNLPHNRVSQWLESKVVVRLYNDLPHPPATYIGDRYDFREADGSLNNVNLPHIGKAGHAYSRSVQGKTAMPQAELPDPDLIFEALLKREKFVPHPAGNSSLMFGFATVVIHTLFRTKPVAGWAQNETSSYVDLSPLYGNDQVKQDMVRKKTGMGKLHNDVFAEDRLLFLPPIACALLVLYCRQHNYIADKLLEINERQRWVNPSQLEKWGELSDEEKMQQDDQIFNTARLINCGHFAFAVFGDYLSSILGLVADLNSWSLNPFDEIRKHDHSVEERGHGNNNSVEFNLLYRWHATVSQPEERWTEDLFTSKFKSPLDTITIPEFRKVTEQLKDMINSDITKWTFDGLQRDESGRFRDTDLARILQEGTANPAGAFKARGIPAALRVIEVMSIHQARAWGCCTLNEFRVSLGLKPYTSFQEWNPRKEIWEAAQKLYESIDRLELYPGLQAEETKVPGPGAGLCPGYTISRAILADAITLTRGDRFFTQNMTPFNYTSWGFADCHRDPKNPGFGSALGPLLLRTLPHHYPADSVFTWFPMVTPERMKEILCHRGIAGRYSFERPIPTHAPLPIESFSTVSDFLGRGARHFKTSYAGRAKDLLHGKGYLTSIDDVSNHRSFRHITKALFNHSDDTQACHQIELQVRSLLHSKSFGLVDNSTRNIDIVNDVLNLAPIHWISDEIGLPLKTGERPRGVIFEQQADEAFKSIFSYIFMENDAAIINQLEDTAKRHVRMLQYHLRTHAHSLNSGTLGYAIGWVQDLLWSLAIDNPPRGYHIYKVLAMSGMTNEEIVNDVLALAVLATVELSMIFVHAVNFYLEDANERFKKEIVETVLSGSHDAMEVLELYAREAIRLDPACPGVLREVRAKMIPGYGEAIDLRPGDQVFLSLKKANMDGIKTDVRRFEVDIRSEAPLFLGDGVAVLLGERFVLRATAHVLRAVFSLKNIRRAPGPSGKLRRYAKDLHGTNAWFYIDQKQKASVWPTSMLLQYDRA